MHEDTAEHIAAAAPAAVRETFLRATLPGFGQALDSVRNSPRRIKRCSARQARLVVSLIDNHELLSQIADHEKRTSVREALRTNPMWQRGPHEASCASCREMPVLSLEDIPHLELLLRDRTARVQELGTPNLCEEQVMRTIAAAPIDAQPRLWAIGFESILRYSARAHVEYAAGRIVVEGGKVPEWGGHNPAMLGRLLDAEETTTPLLLDLALRVRHIPNRWAISADEWARIVVGDPRRTFSCDREIPLEIVVANWDTLPPESRVQALGMVRDQPQIEELLRLLTLEDIAEANTTERHADVIVAILHRFPSLSDSQRLGVISMLSRKHICQYLLGHFGIGPRVEEIDDVLALYRMAQHNVSYRALIEHAARMGGSNENRVARSALIDALVRTAPPRELFAGEHRISKAAHAYTWERLTDPVAITAFASLLEEWQGTLPDLVAAAAGLSA